ncbi:MAG: CPBP family intramembrane metalloprotease [Spirochaetaceae bacterium]|nr:CPBP family intramembrane metalloprotease [Spirochaetaceae bacterium]
MQNKDYPSIKNVIHLCLAFTGLHLLSGILTEVLLYGLSVTGIVLSETMGNIVFILCLMTVYILMIKYLIKKSYVKKVHFFQWQKLNPTVIFLFLVLFSGATLVFSEINYLLYFILPMPSFLVDIFNQAFTLDSLLLSLLLIVIIPAVCEEILFRGFILFGLKRHYSPHKSIFISSLLFGLVHLNPWQFLTAFLLGLIFGWIAVKTESIILPILGHTLNNLMALISVRYFAMEINPPDQFELQPFWLDLTGILLCILGFYFLHQYFKNVSVKKEIL